MRCKIWNYFWYSCFLMLWLNLIPSVNYLHTTLDVAKFLQKSNSITSQSNFYIFKIMILLEECEWVEEWAEEWLTRNRQWFIWLQTFHPSLDLLVSKILIVRYFSWIHFSLQWIDTQCQWGELSKPKTKLHGRPGKRSAIIPGLHWNLRWWFSVPKSG